MDLLMTDDDLAVEDGDLAIVDGIESVAQHLTIRARFVKGEWFLDERIGVPLFEKVLGKRRRIEVIRAIYRKVFADSPEIESITKLDLSLDTASRTLSISMRAIAVGLGPFTYTQEMIL